jgi:hypothetical protein
MICLLGKNNPFFSDTPQTNSYQDARIIRFSSPTQPIIMTNCTLDKLSLATVCSSIACNLLTGWIHSNGDVRAAKLFLQGILVARRQHDFRGSTSGVHRRSWSA